MLHIGNIFGLCDIFEGGAASRCFRVSLNNLDFSHCRQERAQTIRQRGTQQRILQPILVQTTIDRFRCPPS